jgi:2-hydroxycyclohexanecarboxyl-CoA dehydrogenase
MASRLFSETALSGRTALVTGGAKGIGAEIVRVLSDAGASVTFIDRNLSEGQELAAQTGGSFVQGDLLDTDWIGSALGEIGHLDFLINNVGVDQHAFFTQTNEADWDRLIGINLKSVFATCHAAIPSMQAHKFGRIINIASEAARQGSKGGSVYAAAKGGVISFTKSLARENARFGITANVICPGPVRTPLLDKAVAEHGGDKLEDAMRSATLLGRLGTPAEVANTVAFFASEEAGFITGEVLGVSGGMGC